MNQQETEKGGKGALVIPEVDDYHLRRKLIDVRNVLALDTFDHDQVEKQLQDLHKLLADSVKAKKTRVVWRIYQIFLELYKIKIAAAKLTQPQPERGGLNVGIIFNTAEQSRLSEISTGLGITLLLEPCEEPESGDGIEASNGSVPPGGEHGTGNGRVHDPNTDPPAV